MELINHTPYASKLYRTMLNEREIACSPILRVTYDVYDRAIAISKKQSWPVSFAPWETEYGPMPNDNVFRKNGVDIMVFGSAIARGNKPVEKVEVSVNIKNKLNHRVIVFGDRHWQKGERISRPKPFVKIPMTMDNAYGGLADWDGLKVPYNKNLYGKGYIIEKEEMINKKLPNIEDPNNLIQKWDQRPNPTGVGVCLAPGLKAEKYLDFDSAKKQLNINHRIFNQAFPEMIVKQVALGDNIIVKGMSPNGVFSVYVPQHQLSANIQIGTSKLRRNLKVDQIGLIPEANQIFITYRYPFKYTVKEMEKRICEITENIS